MDLVTHILSAVLAGKVATRVSPPKAKISFPYVVLGGVYPDIGEIPIQQALSAKNNTPLAVYNAATSDPIIAQDFSITLLYDTTHSAVTLGMLFIIWVALKNSPMKNIIFSLMIGLFTHIFLDSFTHGKVWALKLFYPISNQRFEILAETVGNWWDIPPTVHLPILGFDFPLICPIIWCVLLILIRLTHSFINKTSPFIS